MLDGSASAVECDFASSSADIAVVGIGHLSRAVDDASHHGNVQTDQVLGGLPDFSQHSGEVELCPAAAGSGPFSSADFNALRTPSMWRSGMST